MKDFIVMSQFWDYFFWVIRLFRLKRSLVLVTEMEKFKPKLGKMNQQKAK